MIRLPHALGAWRRSGVPVLCALAVAVLSAGCGAGAQKAPESKDVLLITVDSLRADRPGFMGGGLETPGMDSLARDAAVFTQAISPVPQTLPSLVSLQTGLYPPHSGVRDDGLERLAGDKPVLAALFEKAGYTTGAFAAALALHPKYGLDRGYDTYADAFADIPRPRTSPSQGIPAAKITEDAIAWLGDRKPGERYFLWVNYFDPHYFYEPPSPFKEDHADSPYDGEVAYADAEIGKLLAWMRDHGRDRTAVIVLAGNHGEGLGDGGEKYHGILLREATLRTPLVVRPAGGLKAEIKVDTPVSLVDVAPTILDLAGLEPAAGMDGKSLAAFTRGGSAPPAGRDIYFETMLPRTLFGWAPMRGVRSGSLKYVESPGTADARLYDLSADPNEADNLAEARPEDAKRLMSAASKLGGGAIEPPAIPADVEKMIADVGLLAKAPSPPKTLATKNVETGNAALQAHRSYERRMANSAIFLLQDVLKADPNNKLALLDAASMSIGSGQMQQAARLLAHAQAEYPADGEVYHLIAHLVIRAPRKGDKPDTPKKLFEIATRLAPLNEEALYDVACKTAAEDPNASLDYLQRSVRAGFRDFKHMAVDEDLDPIRDMPRFTEITGGKAVAAAKTGEGGGTEAPESAPASPATKKR